jgi:hypothetical protein
MNSTPLSFAHDRLVISDRVVARAVSGATVLLNLDNGRSFMLDDVGARAWSVLMSSASIQDAYDSLLTEYQVEPDQLRTDLASLIVDLEAQGLLEIRRG